MIYHWSTVPPEEARAEPAAVCVPHVNFALKTPRSDPRIEGSAMLVGGRLSCGKGVMRSFLFLSDREGKSAREVLPPRPRGTVGFAIVPVGRGPLYVVTSNALEGPSEDIVFRSEDAGRTWRRQGEIPKGTAPHLSTLAGFASTARGRIGAATIHTLATGVSAWVCQSSADGRVWRFEAVEAVGEPLLAPAGPAAPTDAAAGLPIFRCPGFSEPRPGAHSAIKAPKSAIPGPIEARAAWALPK